jgi:hypothetical protein
MNVIESPQFSILFLPISRRIRIPGWINAVDSPPFSILFLEFLIAFGFAD